MAIEHVLGALALLLLLGSGSKDKDENKSTYHGTAVNWDLDAGMGDEESGYKCWNSLCDEPVSGPREFCSVCDNANNSGDDDDD